MDTTEVPKRGLRILPPEVLELVLHYLDSIDDVHSFGRAHSMTHHVIKRQTVYTEIMRSIIGRSWQHRYDLQLCKALRLHSDIVRHFQEGGVVLPVSSDRGGQSYNPWEQALANTTSVPACASGPCAKCIPDDVVHEILARYQGMRVLETLWLKRQLEETDYLAVDTTQDEKQLICRYTRLLDRSQDFDQGGHHSQTGQGSATHGYAKLNPDQRGRLYSAVTFVWILNELRWVLTNFVHPSQSNRHVEILNGCRADLTDLCHHPVLDQLDQRAVFTFMYHHLLPLHSPLLQDQDSSTLPFTFATEWQTTAAQSSRLLQLFLLAGQTYFQPPDLIDLAVRHKLSRSPPYPEMALPATTKQWVRPAKTFTFPPRMSFDDVRCNDTLARLSSTHISLINCSSFARTQANNHNHGFRHSLPTSSSITDLASRYFVDAAVAAIEKGDSYGGNRSARDIITGRWQKRGMWSVWWWANSEDKARAIIARWREEPKPLSMQRIAQSSGMPV